ncbi:MAG: CPBP family intramembrane glutamic endopeptidase [Planctomycetota bacterium]
MPEGRARSRDRGGPFPRAYAEDSRRPLHVLAFLLPAIIAYEVGLAMQAEELAGGGVRAWTMLADVLSAFSLSRTTIIGFSLPAIVIVVVLLVWHVLEKSRWRVRPVVLGWMAIETLALTAPLLLISGVLGSLAMQDGPPAGDGFSDLSWRGRLVIAIGAGLYEELLFRLALIPLLHSILADLMRLGPRAAFGGALVLSSAGFALYHDVLTPGGIDLWAAVLYFVPGLYFGALFLVRGFGIAAGVHVAYDVAVLVLLGPAPG